MAQTTPARIVWTRAAFALAAVATVALVVWSVAGGAWAFAVAALGLAVMLVHHLANLDALARWLRDPLELPLPAGSGVWEQAFSSLYRHLRTERERQRRLSAQLERFRRAGQATPDAVIILDQAHHIEWCNTTAERYFGIEYRRDAGQNLANLVRHPDFVAFLEHGRWDEPLLLRIVR